MVFNVAKIASARASSTISLTKSLRVAGPLDRPMCLTFAINILVAMGTVTWRIPQLFYTKYGECTSNHCGSVRGTLWRIVSKYILFFAHVSDVLPYVLSKHDKSRYGQSGWSRQITIWGLLPKLYVLHLGTECCMSVQCCLMLESKVAYWPY